MAVMNMRKMSVIEKYFSIEAVIGLLLLVIKCLPTYFLSLFLYKKRKYKQIWLISERYNEARDNGYHFYKYIKENNKNKNCYYVIHKNSNDLNKILKYRDIIYFGSYKHYLYYFLAERHIMSHGAGKGLMPNIHALTLFEVLLSIRAKKIYLKHGIVKDYHTSMTKEKSGYDMIICGALPEYNYILENFGYSSNEVRYLGLARFDELLKNNSVKKGVKNILFMPTWRKWLDSLTNKEFKNSDFYKKVQSLINNELLTNLLQEHNITFTLCLHPKFQKYAKLFTSTNKNVEIANIEKTSIQCLLKSSSMLITDFSSVYFDFAYMNKPIIYYQFDYSEFRELHYGEGYFQYKKDGFGPIVVNQIDLVRIIEEQIRNCFIQEDIYSKRVKLFFPLRDTNNNFRIFNAIKNLN